MSESRRPQYDLVDEPLPPYSSSWGNDIFLIDGKQKEKEEEDRRRGPWMKRVDTIRAGSERVAHTITLHSRETVWPAIRDKTWPAIKRTRFSKKQVAAFLLVSILGILPCLLAGFFTGGYEQERWFFGIFSAKTISCGNDFGTPQNSTIAGVEALFTLDATFGRLAFSQVKIIDVAWDIGVGRGVQLCCWAIGYKVFSDALLRVIERHPTSFETFTHICIQGPSLQSVWSLLKDLFRTRSKRTWFLFLYFVISSSYVISLPTILGAMTGYTSTQVAWIDTGSDQQIIPASTLEEGMVVNSYGNLTFNNTCISEKDYEAYSNFQMYQEDYCSCQMWNGTILPWTQFEEYLDRYDGPRYPNGTYNHDADAYDCWFNYTGNSQTFTEPGTSQNQFCNGSYRVEINGNTVDLWSANTTYGYCNGQTNQGYAWDALLYKTRCLPDTANPAYQWGFSSMLSGVFLIMHAVWSVTMYFVWQDAQFNSNLVKSGYAMNMLRATFAISTAARWKTGMGSRELVRTDTKDLKKELYGGKAGKKGKKRVFRAAEVDMDVFRESKEIEDEEESELRRRNTSSTIREEREV